MTTLEQIANKLKTARESKGLSIEQICDKTKIPLHHLSSLDEGKFDDLPELIYVAGFIKLYANQLGLNGQLLANEYREWADRENPVGSGTAVQNKNRQRIKSAPDVPILVSDDYFQKNKIETSPPTFKTIYFNLIMIVLVLALVSYLGMTQFNNYSSQLEGNNVVTPQAISSSKTAPGGFDTAAGSGVAGGGGGVTGSNGIAYSSSTAGGGSVTSGGSTASDTTPGTGGSTATPSRDQLSISANKHVWVEVKSAATGDNLYIGFLEPGSTKVFDTPDQGLRIRAADGSNLNVNYQGKIVALGAAGQETEKVFAPNDTAAASSAGTAGSHAGASTSAIAATSTAAAAPAAASTSTTKPATAAQKAAPQAVHHWHPAGSSGSTSSSHAADGQPYKYGDGRLDTE